MAPSCHRPIRDAITPGDGLRGEILPSFLIPSGLRHPSLFFFSGDGYNR